MFNVITNYPVAYESPDHIWGHNPIENNYANTKFNHRLYEILDNLEAKITDWGCAGGGFIRECLDDGYAAVGLEGSDIAAKQMYANWPLLYNKNLFTCDITREFQITFNGEACKFDCITSWEVLEHIHADAVDTLMSNIVKHIKPGGYYICSIHCGSAEHCKMTFGHEWGTKYGHTSLHQNVNTPEYWDRLFWRWGFEYKRSMKESFQGQFIRGPGIGCWPNPESDIYDKPAIADQYASINRVYQRVK